MTLQSPVWTKYTKIIYFFKDSFFSKKLAAWIVSQCSCTERDLVLLLTKSYDVPLKEIAPPPLLSSLPYTESASTQVFTQSSPKSL